MRIVCSLARGVNNVTYVRRRRSSEALGYGYFFDVR